MLSLLLPVLAYLLGSISTAIITCKLAGLPDPRASGSNNPGATNVLRIGGRKAAAATLVGDMLKGLLPVILAKALDAPLEIIAATALAAFLGHLFPLFFGFKGGKGVATAIGATFGLSWISGLLLAATWLAVSLTFRISSLAALSAFALAPLYAWVATGQISFALVMIGISVLLFWRHRANVQRILAGTEPRIGDKKKNNA
ncbi:MAG TPA: acyl-phosphate glycerol 3-phosphate acyltransferase [Gammaproteobacteria bacterium]|jgi:glycerol-3-phosphate acyltransferase PlsY|nr:acyl-phosphate glycerol 3-phosphate acyltransferase [Gammaproteobacteria bacterium]